MLQKFLTVILPLSAPIFVYSLWWWLSRRARPKSTGETPWTWLIIMGFALMIIAFIVLGLVNEQ
ncbi:MAG: LPXTG cell wall anchor domain-containing protein [Alphaproteobacteria bacterium]|nr:LPXTG cell wall anchor domain-containing protein [Alphaproteobacteria bacterium]